MVDLAIFFQLFYVFIFAKKHLNAVLHINIDSETLNPNAYQMIYINYSIWLNVTPIREQAITCDKINERFNRIKKASMEPSQNRGDLNVVLDLVFQSSHSLSMAVKHL